MENAVIHRYGSAKSDLNRKTKTWNSVLLVFYPKRLEHEISLFHALFLLSGARTYWKELFPFPFPCYQAAVKLSFPFQKLPFSMETGFPFPRKLSFSMGTDSARAHLSLPPGIPVCVVLSPSNPTPTFRKPYINFTQIPHLHIIHIFSPHIILSIMSLCPIQWGSLVLHEKFKW